MAKDINTIGVITEQGDLGLGFNPITEEEASTMKENEKQKKESKEE